MTGILAVSVYLDDKYIGSVDLRFNPNKLGDYKTKVISEEFSFTFNLSNTLNTKYTIEFKFGKDKDFNAMSSTVKEVNVIYNIDNIFKFINIKTKIFPKVFRFGATLRTSKANLINIPNNHIKILVLFDDKIIEEKMRYFHPIRIDPNNPNDYQTKIDSGFGYRFNFRGKPYGKYTVGFKYIIGNSGNIITLEKQSIMKSKDYLQQFQGSISY